MSPVFIFLSPHFERMRRITQGFLTAGAMLLLLLDSAHSQTHLKVTLSTTEPIESAVIVHWTDREIKEMPFKKTLELDLKTRGIDFYHINYLAKGKGFSAKLYLDRGNVEVVTEIVNGKLLVRQVKGSPFYKKSIAWKKKYDAVVQTNDPASLDAFLLRTYEENIGNIFSFHIGTQYLDLHQNDKLKLYALLPLIDRQAADLKTQFGFSILNNRLRGILRNDIVELAGFELIDRDRRSVHAKTTGARFIILDFWFVGCIPCMEDHKTIAAILPRLKEKLAEIISISSDDSYETWRAYLSEHTFNWQNYKKPTGTGNIIDRLGITTSPNYILLDGNGKIIFTSYSLKDVLKQLD